MSALDMRHDPLCGLVTYCICDELAHARADERERIAQAIEDSYTSDYSRPAIRAYEDAARIARGDGHR